MNNPHVYRTNKEVSASERMSEIFAANPEQLSIKLENFPKYVRRVQLKRFLALYEIYKKILPVKGSIVELGVFRGFGLMSWAKLSAILEPENLTRRIYGFDTFDGFPSIDGKDCSGAGRAELGELRSNSYDEILGLISEYDKDRYLGHIPKVELVKGDVTKTVPGFLVQHPHLVVSLLYLDLDLFEPTKAALEAFVPRMPRGSIIA